MRQIWITKTGAPDVLELKEAPEPEARSGQVRVRVRASGINFADLLARVGLYPDAVGRKYSVRTMRKAISSRIRWVEVTCLAFFGPGEARDQSGSGQFSGLGDQAAPSKDGRRIAPLSSRPPSPTLRRNPSSSV